MVKYPIGVQIIVLIFGIIIFLRILYAFGLFPWWIKEENAQEKEIDKISFRRKYINKNNLEHYFHDQLIPFQKLLSTILLAIIVLAIISLIKGSYDYFFAEFGFQKLRIFLLQASKVTFFIAGIFYISATAKILLPSIFLWDFPYLLKGNRAQGKKNYSKALGNFEKAVKYFSSEYGYYKLGQVKREIEKERIREQQEVKKWYYVEPNFNEAIKAYSKSLEFDYPYYKTYAERAELRVEMYEYDEAIEDLNKAMEIAPKESISWVNQKLSVAFKERALCKEVLEDREGAIEDLSKAILLNPDAFELLKERANLKFWVKDFQGAIHDFSMFIISSRYSEDHAVLKLKYLHEVLGEYENYVLLIKSIISKRGKSDELIRDLANLIINRGDTQSSIRVYKKSSTIDEALMEKYLTWEDRFQEGLKIFEGEKPSFSFYKKKSKHYADFGKLELAIETLSSGFDHIENKEDQLEYFLNIGNLYFEAWDYENAIDAFYQGWKLDTEKRYPVFNHSLALIRKNRAEFTEALDLYQNYIDLRRSQGMRVQDYMYIHLTEILTALRKYEDVLNLINAWDNETPSKTWSNYTQYGYEMDKMIAMREKVQAIKLFGGDSN